MADGDRSPRDALTSQVIERSLLNLQPLAGHLLNSLCDGTAMNRAECKDPHDEEIERALGKIESVFSFHTFTFYLGI